MCIEWSLDSRSFHHIAYTKESATTENSLKEKKKSEEQGLSDTYEGFHFLSCPFHDIAGFQLLFQILKKKNTHGKRIKTWGQASCVPSPSTFAGN